MRKYVKLTLFGLAAMALVAGCSKKEETPAETTVAAAEATESEAEIVDKGKVTKLGTYKGIEVTKMSTEVSDEELETRIQNILAANPEHIEVTNRAAQNGDIVNIDYVGMKDGVAFEGGTAEGYNLELGSGSFIDGFEEGLIGAKTGDEVSLNLTFPEEYHSEELAGQEVVFDVTVNSIEEVKEAVLDEAFVQRMSDFTTVDEFRADTLADMETEKEEQAERQIEADAFMAAIDNSEYELNQAAVDQQYENQINYFTNMVQMMYGVTLEDYVAVYGMTLDQFESEIRTAAESAVKEQLLVAAIAAAEGLKVEDADREALAAQYGMDVQTLMDSNGEESVDEGAMVLKVVGFIKDNAVVK